MDIHIDIPKEWVQWFVVLIGFGLAKLVYLLIFDFEPYPKWGLSSYISDREWARLFYWLIDDFGTAATLILLLRATGFLKFISQT